MLIKLCQSEEVLQLHVMTLMLWAVVKAVKNKKFHWETCSNALGRGVG
jgi:hypothetical protein